MKWADNPRAVFRGAGGGGPGGAKPSGGNSEHGALSAVIMTTLNQGRSQGRPVVITCRQAQFTVPRTLFLLLLAVVVLYGASVANQMSLTGGLSSSGWGISSHFGAADDADATDSVEVVESLDFAIDAQALAAEFANQELEGEKEEREKGSVTTSMSDSEQQQQQLAAVRDDGSDPAERARVLAKATEAVVSRKPDDQIREDLMPWSSIGGFTLQGMVSLRRNNTWYKHNVSVTDENGKVVSRRSSAGGRQRWAGIVSDPIPSRDLALYEVFIIDGIPYYSSDDVADMMWLHQTPVLYKLSALLTMLRDSMAYVNGESVGRVRKQEALLNPGSASTSAGSDGDGSDEATEDSEEDGLDRDERENENSAKEDKEADSADAEEREEGDGRPFGGRRLASGSSQSAASNSNSRRGRSLLDTSAFVTGSSSLGGASSSSSSSSGLERNKSPFVVTPDVYLLVNVDPVPALPGKPQNLRFAPWPPPYKRAVPREDREGMPVSAVHAGTSASNGAGGSDGGARSGISAAAARSGSKAAGWAPGTKSASDHPTLMSGAKKQSSASDSLSPGGVQKAATKGIIKGTGGSGGFRRASRGVIDLDADPAITGIGASYRGRSLLQTPADGQRKVGAGNAAASSGRGLKATSQHHHHQQQQQEATPLPSSSRKPYRPTSPEFQASSNAIPPAPILSLCKTHGEWDVLYPK